jgi:orotate phosphoribosyltransferase
MIAPEKKAFIEFMMSADVLRFGAFTTKSGRLSPYFVNTGNYKTGGQIRTLGSFYAQLVKDTVGTEFDCMFGPAYKGIPLVTTTAAALAADHGIDKPYFFNRKEAKDHGEGGSLVGYKPQDGDRIIIIEDVITAGTAVRETLPILKAQGDVEVLGLVVSVDRCERGQGEKGALQEVAETYGMKTCAIVTMKEVVEHLWNRPYKGKVIIDDELKGRIDDYYRQYGVREA